MQEKLRPFVSILAALTALCTSCTALWKAVDKTLERRSYEATSKAIEEIRKENRDLRAMVNALVVTHPRPDNLEELLKKSEVTSQDLVELKLDAVPGTDKIGPSPSSSACEPPYVVAPSATATAKATASSSAIPVSAHPMASMGAMLDAPPPHAPRPLLIAPKHSPLPAWDAL